MQQLGLTEGVCGGGGGVSCAWNESMSTSSVHRRCILLGIQIYPGWNNIWWKTDASTILI